MKKSNHAPSLDMFQRTSIKLECEPELVRAIWKACSRAEVEELCPAVENIDRGWFNPLKLRELKREAINLAAGFHGVEYLGRHRHSGQHVYILNAGDTYATTLAFIGSRMRIETFGDLVERGITQAERY